MQASQEILHIICQYCNDPRPERAAEYDECVRRNLANPWVKEIHNLLEPQTQVPTEFKNHPKYREHPHGKWLTFHDAFTYANANLQGTTACLLNLDIFLDPKTDWTKAAELLAKQIVLCLSRIEFAGEGQTYHEPALAFLAFAQSQDAWLFQPPFLPPDCDFELGTLGCDNAIADRIRRAGKIPVNAASRFPIYHVDQARGKTPQNQTEVHRSERTARPQEDSPAQRGQLLLPDIDIAKSVDIILNYIKADELTRYQVVCDVLSRFGAVKND